jgi:hypothetical protein
MEIGSVVLGRFFADRQANRMEIESAFQLFMKIIKE